MDISVLQGTIPNKVLIELPETMEAFDITTPSRLAHFLGQCYHESGGFQYVFENLNYKAETLRRIAPNRFRDSYEAEFYVGRPEQIANKLYGRRMGNGPEHTGDGFKYRGRGYVQLTGKNNYTLFDKVVADDILEHPDLVATKYPLFVSGWFWNDRRLSQKDYPITDSGIMAATKAINGGSNGLAHRKQMTIKLHDLLVQS